MKKLLTSSCVLVSATFLSAQITITQSDLPQSGYTYMTYTDTTPSIALGSASASAQSWNFSSLTGDYPSVPTYGATSWTPYASAFPTSNIYTYGPAALYSSLAGGAPVGSQGMNKGYMFWRTEISGFYTVGFRADSGTYSNINVQVSPNELLIGTPATYGTTFNNSSSWTFPMNINPADYDTFYVSNTVKSLTTDAWGDITTPSGYYPSVIRIHEHLIKKDSVFVRFNNVLIYSAELLRDTLNNYLFMTNGLHYPVSIVHATAQNTVTSVEYYSGTINSLQESQTVNAFTFPNPANDQVYFILPVEFALSDFVTIAFYDCSGRLISEKQIPYSEQLIVSTDHLKNGIYSYRIVGENAVVTKGQLQIIH